jgi:Flp pilus assembly protein TadB
MTLGTILAIIAFLLSDSLLTGPIIIFITLGIPLALAAQRTAKYRKALEEVLPSALQQVANEMASGSSLEKALEAAAQSAPTPADIELGALQRKVAALGMERALEETAEKLQINSFSLAASVLTVGTNQGGNLIHALKRLSTTLVEIQRLNRKIRTASEIGRRVMLFLTIAYVGFSLGWYTLGPQEFSDVIRHPIGNGMFIGSFLTWAVGIIWALKAMRVKV